MSMITNDWLEAVDAEFKKPYYLELRKKLIQIGESNIKLLSLYYTNFKTILLIVTKK